MALVIVAMAYVQMAPAAPPMDIATVLQPTALMDIPVAAPLLRFP